MSTPSEDVKRQLLCEGYDDAACIVSAYVRQGTKVFVARGKTPDYAKQITESIGASCQLVESINDLELVEGADGQRYVKDGVWIVEGPSQRSGVENRNKRKYSRKLWERIIGDSESPQQKLIKARGMIGHLEHPADGRMDGREGALLVIESTLRADGVVWNKFELLDTPNGRILQEYTRKGVQWGVSTRGNGSVASDGTVSESDFWLDTWDAVMRPSTHGAYPTLTSGPEKVYKNKVQESAEKADVDKVTAVQKALVRGTALVESDIGKLDVATALAFIAEAGAALSGVHSATKVDQAAIKAAQPLVTQMLSIMSAVAKQTPQVVESQGSDKGIHQDGFTKVIELLQQKAKDALSDVAEAQQQVVTLKEEREELTKLCDTYRSRLYVSEAANAAAAEKLQIAISALAQPNSDITTRETSVLEDCEALVSAVVEAFPELGAHRAYLAESDSVASIISRSAGTLATARIMRPEPAKSRFPALSSQQLPPAQSAVTSGKVAPIKESVSEAFTNPQIEKARAMVVRTKH
jgi:Prohead core protein serine protease